MIGFDEKETEFLSIKPNTPLNSGKSIWTATYSRDGGKTFAEEESQVLMGTYYLLWGDVEEFTYEAYNFINLASALGGLLESLFLVFSLIPFYFYNPKVT